jgi:D-alanyl-lipoteichoic acid acyltransferase DltB (MBOAT superfamily)
MLFNSLEFVFLFLPITLAGYYALIRLGLQKYIFAYLVVASLAFYSVWNPPYTLLLIGSMLFNYVMGVLIERNRAARWGSVLLLGGIIANVVLLGWFKYANFFVDNINALAGSAWTVQRIILPLAISFYTFQQIAYLVDISRGEVKSGGIMRYATFVIFFPQLIAGPIVHYRDMMPQFFGRNLGRFAGGALTIGLTIFIIGLFKKTVIADSAALFATPVFDAAARGESVGLLSAWSAAITYTIQLYFDFSGYSDMAVGLARMFGIKLAPNFHSPMRATSIIDYWRRWHMTLQQFIVSYMYEPLLLPLTRLAVAWKLGATASFVVSVMLPTFAVFVVIGLWHGAAWTYVVFGAMHGAYLATNEYWRRRYRKQRKKNGGVGPGMTEVYRSITLLAIVLANVMFRADSVATAVRLWQSMISLDQIATLAGAIPVTPAEILTKPLLFALAAIGIIAFMPNTQQFMGRYSPVLYWSDWRKVAPPAITLEWRPTLRWALVMAVLAFFAIAFISRGQSEFIYFNF